MDRGEILPLVRRLGGAPDPLALYAALTEGGSRPDTLLLESADSAAGVGQRSLLVVRSMLRLTCRGREVEAEALSPNGAALRETIVCPPGERSSGDIREAASLLALDRRESFSSRASDAGAGRNGELDERARLLAPGPLDLLRAAALRPRILSDAGPFSHFAAGIFGYDLVDLFESLPEPRTDAHGFPDFVFWIPDRAILVDHLHRATTVFALVAGGGDVEAAYHDAARDVERMARVVAEIGERPAVTAPPFLRGASTLHVQAPDLAPLSSAVLQGGSIGRGLSALHPGEPYGVDLPDQAFAALVRRLQDHVAAGDVFQIVPSRTFTIGCENPLAAYARLRAENPTPYQFFIRSPEFVLFGASPEMAVRVDAKPGRVTIRPIAGTVPRGRTPGGAPDPEMDARLQAALLTSPKELAEHLMLVDLARNDVARVSRPGTRIISRLLALEGYRHVSHLVSEVTGELAEGLDALHAYAATLNMGTLVGAPKIRAAQLLRLHETTKRGAYGGAVGFLTHDGALDTAIVIRSAFVKDGIASVRAGAGVVLDSNPESEAEETKHKAAAVLRALGAGIAA